MSFAATASVANFYIVSQRELYPQDWRSRLKYLPFLMSIGIGLSVNNTKAVIEAVLADNTEATAAYAPGLVKIDCPGRLVIRRESIEEITGQPMYQRARMGLGYLAQDASIFRGMTVEQNVRAVVELHAQAVEGGVLVGHGQVALPAGPGDPAQLPSPRRPGGQRDGALPRVGDLEPEGARGEQASQECENGGDGRPCPQPGRRGIGAGDGNSTRSLTRLLRTSFPIQASRNGLDCGLKSSAWSTQAVAGDPKRAKHIHQQPEHRISYRSLSVHWHITPQAATDR